MKDAYFQSLFSHPNTTYGNIRPAVVVNAMTNHTAKDVAPENKVVLKREQRVLGAIVT